MHPAQFHGDLSREQEIISTKKRLETFQFRRTSGPIAPVPLSPTSSVGRPLSRHGSISSVSFSGSISTCSALATSEQPFISSSDSRPSSFVGPPRPTSHHRRRSSVSTRAESAEMMGITIPDLPPSSSDDNINFGDRDSVRRRALQALEGKNELGSCNSIVEIPDIGRQGILQKAIDREFKLPMSVPSFGISPVSGKRDSFGKFLSSANSLKDQLHTLMEEEEEDQEEQDQQAVEPAVEGKREPSSGCEEEFAAPGNNVAEHSLLEDNPTSDSSAANRHRPANLTLRPLSLMSTASDPTLPMPSYTSTSRVGLRPFSLGNHTDPYSSNVTDGYDSRWTGQAPRQKMDVHSNSLSVSSSASSNWGPASSMSLDQKKQNSISYTRSAAGQSQPTTFTFANLPTPGATPTSERRQSGSSISSFGSISNQDRRKTSEDMFLHQSHVSLLARIAELENALLARSQSASTSAHSGDSADASEAPSDEMVRLVADLKAERDELDKDIEGWRRRVKGLERSQALLGHEKVVMERRMEAERRESWIRDEKLGLLELENGALNRRLSAKEEEISTVNRKLESMQTQLHRARLECDSLREDAQVAKRQLAEAQSLLEARRGIEEELVRLRDALAAEQIYRRKLVSQLDASGVLQTPKFTGKIAKDSSIRSMITEQPRSSDSGFQSVDSACTTVDEENQQILRAPFTLKAVKEESETHHNFISDDEDELARNEDEDDSGINITSPTHSMLSRSSDDELSRSVAHLCLAANSTPVPSDGIIMLSCRSPCSTPSPTPSPCPTPVPPLSPGLNSSRHAREASLSRVWTFPRGQQVHSPRPPAQEVDRFFGCLEDVGNSPADKSCPPTDDRNIFSQRLRLGDVDDEDLPPFVLPVQKVPGETGSAMLEVVLEEDEDEPQCDTPDGRRKLSFPVSVSEDSLKRMSSPFLEDKARANSVSFIFPQTKSQKKECKPASTPLSGRPSEAGHLKPIRSPDTTAGCPIIPNPSNLRSSRSVPPSRIPPPSPSRFIQARTTADRKTASSSDRKPAVITSTSPSSLSRVKPPRATITSPRGVKAAPVSTHGSSLIPQPRVTSSRESQELALGIMSSSMTSAMSHNNDEISERREPGVTSTRSSRLLFPALSSFFPLSSFLWARDCSQNAAEPVFVPKERQLAKLRISMTVCRGSASQHAEIAQCNRCQSGLISL